MSKISAYPELAEAPANDDEFVVVDKSDTSMSPTGTTKRVKSENVTISDASTTVKGKVELATDAETITGTDTVRAVTPSNITAKIDTDGTLAGNSDTRIPSQKAVKTYVDAQGGDTAAPNLLKNGNFINNSTNGYGGTPDDWTSSNANPVQGGIPTLTKQEMIDGLGIADGDIEILLNLNGNLSDLSTNGYNLTSFGSPVYSNDGQMAQALDLESGSSQYANNAAANCRISGSQTFIVFVKPESFAANGRIIAVSDSTPTNYVTLILQSTGVVQMEVSGITGNANSDVVLQTGKWHMIVGVYDTVAGKVKIWVNGIKKENTVTGSHTAGTGGLSIGRLGDYSAGASYYDGLVQNAAVLSIALSDTQVKKLLAMTLYKGQKIRRATTNAIQYQDLPMNVVENLRGKTVALRADMYQSVASTGQISILQTLASGSTDETIISATDATTGSWIEKLATGAISATAVGIRIQLKHSTSDGNTWFKNVSLYEGSTLLPYDHSKEDWSRFPRLLKMDLPAVISGYQFEENRDFTWTPNWTGYSAAPTGTYYFNISGKRCTLLDAVGGFGTSNATGNTVSLPVVSSSFLVGRQAAYVVDNGSNLNGRREITSTTILTFYKDLGGTAFTGSGSKWGNIGGFVYQID